MTNFFYSQPNVSDSGQIPKKRFTDKRSVRVFLLSLLLGISLLIALGTYAAAKLKSPLSDDAVAQTITIPKGASSRAIAQILEQEGIISGDQVFLYYLFVKGASDKIQAGTYELSASMTIPEVVEKLTLGKVVSNEVRIRIGEGWNLAQIAAAVEAAGLGSKDEFYQLAGTPPWLESRPASPAITANYDFLSQLPPGATLEGYLFPDTYLVSREGGVEEFVHKALRTFGQRLNTSLREQALAQNRNLHQVITMASLIEGEVGRNITGRLTEQDIAEIAQERFIVADIFWTRLMLGMALESDATISYATGKPKARSTLADLEISSPYNTYRNAGLPPGPINNPSLAAIEAVLNPANTPYLFFLSDPSGKAYFARTLEEHIQNRAKYLPIN